MLASVVACGLVGCALDFDGIGFTGGGGASGGGPPSTSTEKTTTGTPGSCEKDSTCVPAPPFGWIGPAIGVPGDEDCGAGTSTFLYAGETVTPAACPCEAVGAMCSGGQVDYFGVDQCLKQRDQLASDVIFSSPGGCDPIPRFSGDAQGAHADFLPALVSPGSCVASNPAPEPLITNPVRLCGLTTPMACGDDGACAPPGASACIAGIGNVECPAEYPGLQGRYQAAVQTCSCTSAPAAPCNGQLAFFTNSACSGSPVATLDLWAAAICAPADVPVDGVWARYSLDQEPVCAEGIAAFQQLTWTVCCL